MDKATISELYSFILESILLINKRFVSIKCSDDFMYSDEGLEKLDAISMRLQAIGEALKNIDKRDSGLLISVAPKKYWSMIIKTREILTHHYIEIDAETIYDICDEKMEELEKNIKLLQNNIDD